MAINNRGEIVGWSQTDGNRAQHAVYWHGGNKTDLGTLGGTNSYAYDINDMGQIVGAASIADDLAMQATFWNGPILTGLGTLPGGRDSHATAINNLGQVAGYSGSASGTHGVVWDAQLPIDLGVPAASSYIFAINDLGTAAGISTDPTTYPAVERATLWDSGSATVLWSPWDSSYAMDINNAGYVAGWHKQFYVDDTSAVLWIDNLPTYLEKGPYRSSRAYGLNNRGQTVGAVSDSGYIAAALWDGTILTDLNSLLDEQLVAAGWRLNSAMDINDEGWIIGEAENPRLGIVRHAFVLAPATSVPEPGTVLLLATAVALLISARRRPNR